jgi:pyruvyltransferase
LDCPEIYGDPALLLPRFYAPRISKRFRLGIVPHFTDRKHPIVDRLRAMDGVRILDVSAGVEEFVDELCSCEVIASSSLHGLIAADSYGIPSLWIEISGRVTRDCFKFHDYYSGIGRTPEGPTPLTEATTEQEILDRASHQPTDVDLDRLLESCPFARSTTTVAHTIGEPIEGISAQ